MSNKTKEPPTDEATDALIERARLCFQACEGLPDSALERGSVAKLVRASRAIREVYSFGTKATLGGVLRIFKELV